MAVALEMVPLLLTMGGMVYLVLALWGARSFAHGMRGRTPAGEGFAPGVTVLKPLHGVDARMYEGLRSHCVQRYAGPYELVFGVSSAEDAACAVVERLRGEFPEVAMRLVVCAERLGTSGKVSNLLQMAPLARYEFVLVNDADIAVGPRYLERVMDGFGDAGVGMVTALYMGWAEGGVWSRMEALGIATDFMPGVLTARMLEGGIGFGLGSTLAMRGVALQAAGGFRAVVNCLADDYELGVRIARAGWRVALCGEVVTTTVPAYDWRGFRDHQMRWARTVRDARRWGYLGLGATFCVPWAMVTCVASGLALWSFALLSLAVLLRVSVALTVGVGVLGDGQVLRDWWLLPLRDWVALGFWVGSFAGDTVMWRGERFRLRGGRLERG